MKRVQHHLCPNIYGFPFQSMFPHGLVHLVFVTFQLIKRNDHFSYLIMYFNCIPFNSNVRNKYSKELSLYVKIKLAVNWILILVLIHLLKSSLSSFLKLLRHGLLTFLFSFRRYNLSSKSWLTLDPSVNTVTPRYGHSLALHEVCGARNDIYREPGYSFRQHDNIALLS